MHRFDATTIDHMILVTLEETTMTIDERIERLTERHEALTQSVELLLVATRENTDHIRKLVEVTNRDAEDIRALARIAEIHDRRITGIEGGRP
jgi:hypothetical protein